MGVKQKIRETIQEKREESGSSFHGWKANLVADTDEFSLNIPIRYAKLDASHIDEKRNIKRFHGDYRVQRRLLGEGAHFGYVVVPDECPKCGHENISHERGRFFECDHCGQALKGPEVDRDEVIHKQRIDGEWKRVQKYEKTEEIVIKDFIAKKRFYDFNIEKTYEVWPEKVGLWKLAKYLLNNELIGVSDHVVLRKSFKKYWALFLPAIRGDRFTMRMDLTRTTLKFEHLRKTNPDRDRGGKKKSKLGEPRKPESAIEIEI